MNLRNMASAATAITIAGFFLVWNQGWLHLGPQAPAIAAKASCVDLAQGCNFELAGQSFSIRSDQPISAAQPFTLILQGAALKQATASWQMAEMDMGPNSFRFTPGPDQSWQTQTALPMCTQARHDWLLTLTLDRHQIVLTTQSR